VTDPATVALVHGAAAGSWTWHLVTSGLEDRSIDTRAVDLPSCSASGPTVDLHDDARHVRGVLDEVDGPVVLVGNSYGGAVISEAAVDCASVKQLVYIAALMPRPDEHIADILGGLKSGLTDAVHLLDDARLVFDPDIDIEASFQHASAEERAFILPRLGRPMSMGLDTKLSLPKVAWQSVPSTYVVCADDLALPPEVQRSWAAERATETIEWPVDHSPQHSRPDLVVDLLERLARQSA
jgi:pimeloyl-ACP methyl ester carboxylesterase